VEIPAVAKKAELDENAPPGMSGGNVRKSKGKECFLIFAREGNGAARACNLGRIKKGGIPVTDDEGRENS